MAGALRHGTEEMLWSIRDVSFPNSIPGAWARVEFDVNLSPSSHVDWQRWVLTDNGYFGPKVGMPMPENRNLQDPTIEPSAAEAMTISADHISDQVAGFLDSLDANVNSLISGMEDYNTYYGVNDPAFEVRGELIERNLINAKDFLCELTSDLFSFIEAFKESLELAKPEAMDAAVALCKKYKDVGRWLQEIVNLLDYDRGGKDLEKQIASVLRDLGTDAGRNLIELRMAQRNSS
jgi:hypothetical protein